MTLLGRGAIAVPLSLSQAGRLFAEEMPASRLVPFHLVRCFRVAGDLSRPALAAALDHVVNRHAALRTAFVRVADPPGAVADEMPAGPRHAAWMVPEAHVPWLTVSAPDGDPVVSWADGMRAVAVAARRPFALAEPPLLRALLVRTGPQEHLVALIAHHLVVDRWSMSVIEQELFGAYDALRHGQAPQLPLVALQFVDFAPAQRARLESGALDPSIAYWRTQWERYGRAQVRMCDLPFARRDVCVGFSVDQHAVVLGAPLTERVRTFVRQRRASVYALLFTAFATVLHLCTGRPRVALWGPFANRTGLDAEGAVGWFAHLHLLGVECLCDTTLERLLTDVKRVILSAHEHQEVPPSFLWTALGREAADSFNSEVWLSFDYLGGAAPCRASALTVEVVAPPVLPARTSLQMLVTETAHGIVLTARYSRDLFDSSAIRAVLEATKGVVALTVEKPASTQADARAAVRTAALPLASMSSV